MRPFVALSLSAMLLAPVPARAQNLKIGLVPEQNVFKQKERYVPLGRYLSAKTGHAVSFTVLARYANILERFTAERLDGAFFGSFTGALAIRRLGVEPLARPVNLDGSSTYRGYLFVRKDSGIRTVADMKGKRLAFVEKATTAGYAYPVAYFKQQGVSDVNRHFREVFFAGSHDAAIAAVLDGKADVGCAKNSVFDQMARRDPRVGRDLAILERSSEVPSNGLCVRKGLPEETRRGLRDALVGMEADPEGRKVLKEFEALRFVPTAVGDYGPVFEIARAAGIDPKTFEYINR